MEIFVSITFLMGDNAHSKKGGPATPRQAPKLSQEALDKMVTKLYTDAVTHKESEIKKLTQKYLPVAPPSPRSAGDIAAIVDKNYVKAMEIKKSKHDQLVAKAAKETAHAAAGGKEGPKKLSEEEVDESVRRLYTDCMRIRQETRARMEKKMEFKNRSVEKDRERSNKHTKEELLASAKKLSQPKKTTFNADEINKLWLNVDTHYCDDKRAEEEDEASS